MVGAVSDDLELGRRVRPQGEFGRGLCHTRTSCFLDLDFPEMKKTSSHVISR